MNYEEVLEKLEKSKNPRNADSMARFGIRPKAKVYGVSMPAIRKIAKEIKKDHKLALKLFDSKIHEAKILATIIAQKEKITEKEIECWIKKFDSWDIVDQCCMNLFSGIKISRKKIKEWAENEKEFIRRTAFSMIAVMAVKNKEMKDEDFLKFFSLIAKYATDERNFVKKAVNWALRQIGKRNKRLNKEAINLARNILEIGKNKDLKSVKWIANNALLELTSEKYQKRFKY